MAEITNCPSCERKVKIPESLMGKKVKCPSCGTVFTAAAAEATAADPHEQDPYVVKEERQEEPVRKRRRVPEDEDEEDVGDEPEDIMPRPRRIRSRRTGDLSAVRPPAICLLVAGVLGLFFNLYLFVSFAIAQSQPMPPPPANSTPEYQEGYKKGYQFMVGPGGFGMVGVSFLFSLLIIFGSIMMLMGKMRGLAMTACILSMINCCGCCILGIPFGIWGLVALSKSEVAAAFK